MKVKKNESTSTDSDCSETIYKRTSPKCKRCERHGVKNVELKGHKRYCPFQNCGCLICHVVVTEQNISARNIALKRALKNDEKKMTPEEIPPMPWFLTNFKKYGFHVLTNYTLQEISKSGYTVLRDPSKMWYILASLNKCAYDLDMGIKNNAALEFASNISQVIYGCSMIYHPETYCYLAPPPVMAKVGSPDEGQPVDMKFSQYPLPNFPILPPTCPPPTLASPFPENSFKPPTEPLIKSSTELSTESTEPSTDPSTHPSTESSKYYW